jgi:hypothetical protein
MAIGPVQLIVLGFSHPEFHGEIKAELRALARERHHPRDRRAGGAKDAQGELEVEHSAT